MKANIACATDFSIPSIRLADAAAAIAGSLGEDLLLIHVFEPPAAAAESLTVSLRITSRNRLHAEAARLRQAGVAVYEHLLEGYPCEAISGFVARERSRMLMMAPHPRRNGPDRWYLGGVAERVIKRCAVPVMIPRDAGAIESWLTPGASPRAILLTESAFLTDTTLGWARELACLAPFEILISHAAPRPADPAEIVAGFAEFDLLILEEETAPGFLHLLDEAISAGVPRAALPSVAVLPGTPGGAPASTPGRAPYGTHSQSTSTSRTSPPMVV